MSEKRQSLGLGALALVPIACCIGLPLLAAAGVSVGLAAWTGGIAAAAIALALVLVVFTSRMRRRRSAQPRSLRTTGNR
jgi:membrane protein implicated in regulation of membrane protease activity